MTTLADELVPDERGALVAPLLPGPSSAPVRGRHRTVSDRNCFAAIVYMARTSTPWRGCLVGGRWLQLLAFEPLLNHRTPMD